MKTKNYPRSMVNLKLFLALPVIFLVLVGFSSCAARNKISKTQTEVSPTLPPPPPPPTVPVPGQKDGDAYLVVDEMPVFPGGNEALLKYIAENTRYPKEAKDNNIQGRVITRFKVKEDGTVSDVSVLKGVDSQLDNEALKVVSSIPKFTPGKLNGVSVPVWYMIPITFTLNGDSQQRPSRFEVIGSDTVYSVTKEMPMFPGGDEAFLKFKTENIKYLPEVKSLGIEGTVLVRFWIEENGSVSNIKIMQGVSPSLDAEAIRVTKLMPAWEPGKENGKPVKFVSMTNFDFLLTPRMPPVYEEGTPFVVVEEMPQFPGGNDALLKYIAENTNYPEASKEQNINGRVVIRFCVTANGSVSMISVLKSVAPELDAEAIRVVGTLPAFKPGKQGGKPVNVWYMVPITFGLTNPADQSGTKTPPPPPPPAGYDEPPVFKGGETALIKFINSKLVYPKTAKEKNISGKVNMRFSVDIDGSINDVSVVKGINPELDAEAIRVIKLLPAWNPGKLDGKPVKVWYNLPVTFTLK
ncbi:MAG: energy transducer TonB [Bacteroidales bacterium]|jgi:TonB family protein